MRFKPWLAIVIITLVPLLSFLHSGFPATHDGRDHVARIANFSQSLSEGNLVPRWAGNLNWGYGHPILMFLYPFPSYLGSLFIFIGLPLLASVKLVFGLSLILSALFMYLWLAEFLTPLAGFAGAVLYAFAPYRFVDLYVRGAIGECWAFVWPPLILWFALKLSRGFKWRYLGGGSVAFAFMILSHNALSLMFLPLIFGYFAFLVFTSEKKILNTFYLALSPFFGFSLSAFFWLPAFAEGKYTLRDIVTAGNISGFEPLTRFFVSSWNYGGTGALSVELGFLQWLAVFFSPWLIYRLRKMKKPLWVLSVFFLLVFVFSMAMMLPAARPLYLKISLLQKFQFAWRWLSLAIFPPAVMAAVGVSLSPRTSRLALVLGIVLASLLLTGQYWRPKGYLTHPESFYTSRFISTTDTGESAPRWSVRFMERFPAANLEVVEGRAEFSEVLRRTNRHRYRVSVTEKSRLVENTLYFPGWQILANGSPVGVEFQDPAYRGLMTFWLDPGEYDIEAVFRETKLRRFANGISLLSLAFLLLGPVGINLAKKRNSINRR